MKIVSYKAIITGKGVGHIYDSDKKKDILWKRIRKIKELQKKAKSKINFPTRREIPWFQGKFFVLFLGINKHESLQRLKYNFSTSTFKMIGRDLSNTLFHSEKVFESTKHWLFSCWVTPFQLKYYTSHIVDAGKVWGFRMQENLLLTVFLAPYLSI